MHSKEVSPPRGLAAAWGVDAPRTRGPEARWSVDDVAGAAVTVADRGDLEAVTLASVARELGLTTTALYRYVDTKEVLFELMVDAAIGEPPGLVDGGWEGGARAWAMALAQRFTAHPWLTRVSAVGMPRRPGVYAWLDALLEALADAPPQVDRMRLGLLLDAVVRGYATIGAAVEPPPAWLAGAVEARFPRLAGELARDWSDVAAELAQAVEVALRGAAAPDAD